MSCSGIREALAKCAEAKDVIPKEMFCRTTGKVEKQELVKSSEDGFYLKCLGCGKVHGYEIGRFAE